MRAPVRSLVAVEACGKHLSVVEHHHVAIVEVVEHLAEDAGCDFAGAAVDHQKAGFVALFYRVFCYQLFGELKLELGKFHALILSRGGGVGRWGERYTIYNRSRSVGLRSEGAVAYQLHGVVDAEG